MVRFLVIRSGCMCGFVFVFMYVNVEVYNGKCD